MNRPARLDVVLRVLDHQVVGPDKELVGNIDDLELTPAGEALAVTGSPSGRSPQPATTRRLGTWVGAVWRRLSTDSDPRPVVIPLGHIAAVGSAITVDRPSARALAESFDLEHWLRRFVVSRIPAPRAGRSSSGRTTTARLGRSMCCSHLPGRRNRAVGGSATCCAPRSSTTPATGSGASSSSAATRRPSRGGSPTSSAPSRCSGRSSATTRTPNSAPVFSGGSSSESRGTTCSSPLQTSPRSASVPPRIIVATRDDRRHPHDTQEG